MFRVEFTRRAQADLHGLFDYLADRFSVTNAERYVDQIEKACLGLGSMPNRGTERSDLRPGLRIMGFRRRDTIAFRVGGGLGNRLAYPLRRTQCRTCVPTGEGLIVWIRSYFGGSML